jgi:hypothetical protein
VDFDDDYDDEYDDPLEYGESDYGSSDDRDSSEMDADDRDLDSMDITDPASAYFFLSDDAQDEIEGGGKVKMECLSCGHRFMGDLYDSCPECLSPDTDEIDSDLDLDLYWM